MNIRLICVLTSMFLLVSTFQWTAAQAEEEYEQKTFNRNVAYNKPVYTNVVLDSDEQSADWGKTNLTDGYTHTMTLMLGNAENEYFIVDLG